MGDEAEVGVFQLDLERLFRFLYDILTNVDGGSGTAFFVFVWDFLNVLSLYLVPLFLFGIIYATVRLHQVEKAEHEEFEEAVRRAGTREEGNPQWQRILNFVNGDNPTEWRHAVIEADVMLDDVLKREGYEGDSLGERLKAVPRERLESLQAAWDAHKVRNEIAHGGSDFILSQRAARQAIDNYRRALSEFRVI